MTNIRNFLSDIHWLNGNHSLLEMANIQPSESGLLPIVHVMSRGGAKHSARVKVSNIVGRFAHDDNFTITAESSPRIIGKCKLKQQHLQDVIDWVKLNRDHLLHIWENGDTMTSSEISSGFIKL